VANRPCYATSGANQTWWQSLQLPGYVTGGATQAWWQSPELKNFFFLFRKGEATEDHTTLLLNCYTKLKDSQKLDEFIMTKVGELFC
jgi:hypothetical protein